MNNSYIEELCKQLTPQTDHEIINLCLTYGSTGDALKLHILSFFVAVGILTVTIIAAIATCVAFEWLYEKWKYYA